MKHWIDNRRVLGAFSDPAGAKAVLAFLCSHNTCANSITMISDREYSFFKEFGCEVWPAVAKSAYGWVADAEVLITGTSYPANLEFELIDAAIKAGIPSISLVDHWTNLIVRFERDGRRVLPDVIGLVDEHAFALAVAEGLPTQKLKVVGNPYHEYLKGWRPQISRENLLVSLGLPPHKPYILYAPEPFSQFGLKGKYGFDEIDGLGLVLQAKKALPKEKFSVVIKGHPNQNHRLIENELSKSPDQDIIYLREGDFNLISFHAATIVGFFSNALVEASLLGKSIIRPLILLNPDVSDPIKSMKSCEWADVFTVDELVNVLRISINTSTKKEHKT